jgi:serine/threonine protein kinase
MSPKGIPKNIENKNKVGSMSAKINPSEKKSSESNGSSKKIDFKVSINDFKLGKTLGEGKFGTVYMAIHKLTQSIYAIKKIPKLMIKNHYMIDQFIL